MIPASRQYYRQSRLLLFLSASGLIAAPLLPLLLPAAPPLLAALVLLFLLTPLFWLGMVLRLRVLRREAPELIGDFTAVARNLLLAATLWLTGAVVLDRAGLKLRRIWRDSSALLQTEQLESWRRLELPPLREIPADCPALARMTDQPVARCRDALGHSLAVELRGDTPALTAPLAATAAPLALTLQAAPKAPDPAPLPLPSPPVAPAAAPAPLPLPGQSQPPASSPASLPPPRRPKTQRPAPEPMPFPMLPDPQQTDPVEPPQSDPASHHNL